jgi:hypothetical protein
MELTFAIIGRCCDLAMHPVSLKTAATIRELGREAYKRKYLQWWRKGNTCSCGMKYDDDAVVQVKLDDKPAAFELTAIPMAAVLLRRRVYLNTKVRYLCILGYDDELCSSTWRWDNVENYDPHKFEFFVHRWDRVMHTNDYIVVDDIRYEGRFADKHQWGPGAGFNLRDPELIDLEEVRKELQAEQAMAV